MITKTGLNITQKGKRIIVTTDREIELKAINETTNQLITLIVVSAFVGFVLGFITLKTLI